MVWALSWLLPLSSVLDPGLAAGSGQAIVTGVSNPGQILIYRPTGAGFQRESIDVGYRYVHTVRVGDIYNDGRPAIVAGVGNSHFGPPWGCWVVAFRLGERGWRKEIIDHLNEPRCKDLAVGDADNDGKNELVLGTHGEGIVKVYKWDGAKWGTQVVERNWIAQVDRAERTNHRVPRDRLTYDYIVQTAVHIVKIADVDHDGKNELIVTMSTPLELKTLKRGPGELGFVRNLDGGAKNDLFVGGAPGHLFMYQWWKEGWHKRLIHRESIEEDMKGLTVGDPYNSGKDVLVLATGWPHSLISTFSWDKEQFTKKMVGNIAELLKPYNPIERLEYNAMEVQVKDLSGDGKKELVVAGLTKAPRFGFEGTVLGFLAVFRYDGTGWTHQILDQYAVLGMDIGRL
ncbi:MAG: hypothetical protein HY278_00375 [candidate division NC10 bacterium]|nr:hypothetical protein [candidate division NC10 bacterium]